MGTEFYKVEIKKHVEVSGDLDTMELVCSFLEKMNIKTTTRSLLPLDI